LSTPVLFRKPVDKIEEKEYDTCAEGNEEHSNLSWHHIPDAG